MAKLVVLQKIFDNLSDRCEITLTKDKKRCHDNLKIVRLCVATFPDDPIISVDTRSYLDQLRLECDEQSDLEIKKMCNKALDQVENIFKQF